MKRLLALALATLMILSLVACGGGGGTTSGATSGGATSGATSGGATEPAKEYKKEVVIGHGTAITQWDPHRDATATFSCLYNMVYDSLLWLNLDTSEVEPRLATSWEFSENNTVLTMKLREDAYFTNGQLFDSDDVVFTWERLNKGAQVVSSAITKLITDVTVEAVDQFTVKFKFKTPNTDFTYSLAQPYLAMMNRDAFKGDDIEWPEVGVAGFVDGANNGYLVGTGQYMYEKHVANDSDTVVKRSDGKYWGEENPTERMTFRLFGSASSRLLALETGEIDYCYGLSVDDTAVVEGNKDLVLLTGDRTGVEYVCFNSSKDGVWQDANFRHAFTKAINRDDVLLARLSGNGVPAYSMYNHLQYGYTSCEDVYGYDLEEAKALLAKSSYKGEMIEIVTISSYKNGVLAIVENLKAVGINAQLKEEANANMIPLMKADTQDCQYYNINLNPNGDDLRRFLGTVPGAQGVDASPNRDKIYALLDQAMAADGDAARKAIYAEIQKILAEDCFFVPIITPKSQNAYVKELEGAYWRANTIQDFRNVCVVVK